MQPPARTPHRPTAANLYCTHRSTTTIAVLCYAMPSENPQSKVGALESDQNHPKVSSTKIKKGFLSDVTAVFFVQSWKPRGNRQEVGSRDTRRSGDTQALIHDHHSRVTTEAPRFLSVRLLNPVGFTKNSGPAILCRDTQHSLHPPSPLRA